MSGSGYKMDMWDEVRRRWLAGGVLAAVALAVLAPRVGAPGGNRSRMLVLHAEYLSYVPLTHIYWSAGARWHEAPTAPRATARACLVAVAHAQLVAPLLCCALVAVVGAMGVEFDHTLARGAVFSSMGGPCAWLSLSVSRDASPVPLLAANYVAALVAQPVQMIIFCGRAAVPPVGGAALALLTALVPFALGTRRPRRPGRGHEALAACTQGSALLLLYADCCSRLHEANGSLHLQKVFLIMFLEVAYVCTSALACGAYARCGLVPASHVPALRAAAVPKALELGWESSTACVPAPGLARLPALFLAPAQALLLAAYGTGPHPARH